MSTVQVNGSAVTATSTNNNGGTAVNVGTSTLLSNQGLGTVDLGVFGSTPIDNATANEARSAGVFAFDNNRGVIRRVTTTLSNVANDVLQSAASVPSLVQSINQTSGTYITDLTTAIRDGRWNAYSGAFVPPLSGVDADFGIDSAANPTRAVPGELYYLQGGKTAVTGTYSAKNT